MKRICCYCDCWESGGIESFLCNILLHMTLKNLEVDLVASQMKESVFTQRLEAHGVRFFELSGNQRNMPKNHALFRSLLQERQYDVVHLNIFQGMSLYYAHLAKDAGVPVRIAHSHNTDLRQSRTRAIKLWLHRQYSKRYAKDATGFWACSEVAAKFMFPDFLMQEQGYTFIPNGIKTERFRFDPAVREAVRQELGIADRFVIGNVGRLCYQKNQSFLLDVLAEVRRQRPDCCLLLVGEGEDRQMLLEKAQTLGIEEHVIFYGTTTQVERLFWAMDVFTFPSLFEGLGIVAIEAQAAGLPVLCSEHVPQEAAATDLLKRISLGDSVEEWAHHLIQRKKEVPKREEYCKLVHDAGFDIKTVAIAIMDQFGLNG